VVSAVIYRDLAWTSDAQGGGRGRHGHRRRAAGDHGLGRHRLAAHLRAAARGIVQWAREHLQSALEIILLMNLMMLAIGMFIDLPAAVLLLTPMFVPLANAVGMDLCSWGS
jgi:hypothetical protein